MTPWSYDNSLDTNDRSRAWPLASVIVIWASALVAATLMMAWGLFSHQLWQGIEHAQGRRVVNTAQAVAEWPSVKNTIARAGPYSPGSALQARIETLRRASGVDFIVVMDRHAIRLTHPSAARINNHFRGGDERDALLGKTYTSIAIGTLGRSVRGFAPVKNQAGDVIGAVSVGVRLAALTPVYATSRLTLLAGLALIGLVGAIGAFLLARRIKRQLHAMEPIDIARLSAEHQAVLDSIHEGLILVGMDRRVRLINPAAKRLLGSDNTARPGVGDRLDNPMIGSESAGTDDGIDRPLCIAGRYFRGSLRAVEGAQVTLGAVISFRDTQELQRLGEELTGVRRYADALRANQHETKNQWHVVLGLAELGDTPSIKRFLTDLIESPVLSGFELATHIADPVLGGFLIAKQAEAREANTTLSLEIEPVIPAAANTADVQAAVGVLGNLIDNAFDALADMTPAREPGVVVALAWESDILSLSVSDNGCGMTPEQIQRATIQGFTSKGGQRGLGLSLVARRLADMGQPLRIYSTPGAGTLVEASLAFEAQA